MRRILLAAAVVLATCAATASAHQGNPNMESVVTAITPTTDGISIEVLNRDDRFQLVNRSGKTIEIEGYEREPYARLLADGTVQVNTRSPAYYLNDDRYAAVEVPASADSKRSPLWETVDRAGRFQWHDHRMHYMAKGVPSSVADRSKRQRVFDYEIPIRVQGHTGAIQGTLFWTPEPDGGPPVAAFLALAAIAMTGVAAVVVVRRRRGEHIREEAW